jgi:hypothetical protein
MLEVLDAVPAHCEMVVQVAVDEFLLSYYVDFFKRTTDAYDTSKAQMLFERVLDTSEPDLDIYTRVIDEIFSMGKDPEWFAGFYHGIWKLLRRAPDNHETLLAVQKGLIGTGKDIKEDIEEIIAYAYENRRKILVHGIQLYEGSIIALMGFQTGAAPEIGMELSSGEVICRIDDFERPYEHGTLYNCLVTVLKGQLTEESRFEVQI